MLCDHCKHNEATMHMTSIVNNQKTEQHLCADCANKLQKAGKFSPFSSFANDMWDNNFFTNDFFQNMVYPDSLLQSRERRTCPHCGISYDTFNRTGKFGCDQCYDTFSKEIQPLLQRIQGTLEYNGRDPSRGNDVFRAKQEIKRLRHQLDEAIKVEDFEQAVQLRDKIKTLEETVHPSAE